MQELRCKKCGTSLKKEDELYICPGCGAKYEAQQVQQIINEFSRLLDEQKQEAVANLRAQLWAEFNEECIDDEKLLSLARAIRGYLPNDFYAVFCELACTEDGAKLIAFLHGIDVRAHADDLADVVRFMFRILRPRQLVAMNDLLERGAQVLGSSFYEEFYPILVRESRKLEEGVYDPLLPRDVFVMYSGADMGIVIPLVEALEREGLRCFVAARNIRHGRKSDYNAILRQAIDSCKVGLFVSTSRSRSHECDALSVEMAYIRQGDVSRAPAQYAHDYAAMPRLYKKPRVEYVAEPYSGRAVEALMRELFAGFERCNSVKDVIAQVLELECGAVPPAEGKAAAAEGKGAPSFPSRIGAMASRIGSFFRSATDAMNGSSLLQEANALYEQKQFERAASLYRTAAVRGSAEAHTRLGMCYALGDGVERSMKRAVKWYKAGAKLGDAQAQLRLGDCYRFGNGVSTDYRTAARWYSRAAAQNAVAAQYAYGVCCENGLGVERDAAAAVRWYRRAAEQGDASAQCALGVCYAQGRGITRDDEAACVWYRKACEGGNVPAHCLLGMCLRRGTGTARNDAEAARLFTYAAQRGHAQAQRELGNCFMRGQGVPKNAEEGIRWLRSAAEQGDPDAQCDLGRCYQSGDGLPKNAALAVQFYRSAAEQGYAEGQYRLGWCYQNDVGVPRADNVATNIKFAVKWYSKAAEQGHQDAKIALQNYAPSVIEIYKRSK